LVAGLGLGLGLGGCGNEKSKQLTITYTLAKPCVRALETESLVTHSQADVDIAYAIIYPDRKFRGAAPRGRTDKNGKFGASWAIPADAPAGPVRVRILAAKGPETANVVAQFTVADDKVPCP
jgi:hypothetical protein